VAAHGLACTAAVQIILDRYCSGRTSVWGRVVIPESSPHKMPKIFRLRRSRLRSRIYSFQKFLPPTSQVAPPEEDSRLKFNKTVVINILEPFESGLLMAQFKTGRRTALVLPNALSYRALSSLIHILSCLCSFNLSSPENDTILY
jgi:hypothetical protein